MEKPSPNPGNTVPCHLLELQERMESLDTLQQQYDSLLAEMAMIQKGFSTFETMAFKVKRLSEAEALATSLAWLYPEPQKVLMGINELLINAIEHGNLAITRDEKNRLLRDGIWLDEINHRLTLPEYRDRSTEVRLTKHGAIIELHIIDQGEGFDWQHYLSRDTVPVEEPYGRGIVLAKLFSFDELMYCGNGNEVIAKCFV